MLYARVYVRSYMHVYVRNCAYKLSLVGGCTYPRSYTQLYTSSSATDIRRTKKHWWLLLLLLVWIGLELERNYVVSRVFELADLVVRRHQLIREQVKPGMNRRRKSKAQFKVLFINRLYVASHSSQHKYSCVLDDPIKVYLDLWPIHIFI